MFGAKKTIKVLIIGDIVAKIGREVVKTVLPRWKKEYSPDVIIANVENLAHGKGVTEKTLSEMKELGITGFTGGNHIWQKENPVSDPITAIAKISLPANDPRTPEDFRFQTIQAGNVNIVLVDLLGQVSMKDDVENPFAAIDALYDRLNKPKHLLVEIHADATSEKVALGYHLNGRASAVFGTHTHIPTADTRILSEGTGYVTDIGMTGSNASVLGVAKETIIKRFLTGDKGTFDYPETGPAWINAIFLELDTKSGKCTLIKRLSEELTIN